MTTSNCAETGATEKESRCEKPEGELGKAEGRLVYGEYWMHDCFALLDEDHAERLSKEIGAIQACTTVGELRRLEPTLKFTWAPGSDYEDDDGEQLPDDAPYDWSKTGAVDEGDWPPMPTAYALSELPTELLLTLISGAGAEVVDTTMNGRYFAIPLEYEEEMLDVLRSAGYEAHRDDGLISSIGTET